MGARRSGSGLPPTARHIKSSLANSTPVTDGDKIVVLFGAIGKLVAYDREGKVALAARPRADRQRRHPSGTAGWGHASSPILYDGKVIVQADRHRDSWLAAYALADGKEAWRIPATTCRAGPPPPWSRRRAATSWWSTRMTIRAYDPKNGKELWHLGPNSEVVVSDPASRETA